MTIVEMRVSMDCPGCQKKIIKSLSKLDGVDGVEIDEALQKVTVTGWADQRKVLKAVRKSTGRNAELWPFPYNPEFHDYYEQYYGNRNMNRNESPNYYYYEHAAMYGSPATYVVAGQPAKGHVSSYNYRVHGYNGHQHGYYQPAPYTTILDEDATSIFSDDNVKGCVVM
ncbi:heavy metal-associated isoprenylated plant protein 29-like [Andrographis paniculata]|uniref:heavy metal-associated isoprenylated plant protein 29-like n=1 Tax=Andrographis paniculata TaxID=175694 RepID=UPI0021E822C5|nr:heavy metal-associated isoprenylated plant protein 29-like [Andrographis paniculata]